MSNGWRNHKINVFGKAYHASIGSVSDPVEPFHVLAGEFVLARVCKVPDFDALQQG